MEFKNKTQIQKWLRATKAKHKAGDRLAQEDEQIFMELLKRHHAYAKKVGVGVAFVFVDWNAKGNTEFRLRRVDGSDEPCGISRIVEGAEYTLLQLLVKATRGAVEPSRDEYRRTVAQLCALCSSTDLPQVDHHDGHRTFNSILEEFIVDERIESIISKEWFTQEKSAPHRFADEYKWIGDRFRAFHDERAVLRMLCRSCNLSRARRFVYSDDEGDDG